MPLELCRLKKHAFPSLSSLSEFRAKRQLARVVRPIVKCPRSSRCRKQDDLAFVLDDEAIYLEEQVAALTRPYLGECPIVFSAYRAEHASSRRVWSRFLLCVSVSKELGPRVRSTRLLPHLASGHVSIDPQTALECPW